MTRCIAIVYQLVPYHDARFSAAARAVDLGVVELFGQNQGMTWSRSVERGFDVHPLHLAKNVAHRVLVRQVLEKLDTLRPETIAVQGWAGAGAAAAVLWARARGVNVIVFSESNIYDHQRSWPKEWVKGRFLNLCDAALVGGQDHVAYLKALGFDTARVALGYNAVDNAHFAPSVSVRSSSAPPYILIASRLAPEKNLARSLDAYARYRARATSTPWDLWIIGMGPLEAELKQHAQDLGVGEHVHFKGFVSYEELPSYYHNAGLLLHASAQEPWGLVVNESLAAGLPVVVSNMCGCRCELVRDGINGFAVDHTNIDDIAERVARFADGRVNRLEFGRQSRAIVAEWGPERFGQGFKEAVDIANARPARPSSLDTLAVKALSQWM